MDKKEIYEHLAKIYLDASKKKKAKTPDLVEVRDLVVASLIVIGIYILLTLAINLPNNKIIAGRNPSLPIKSGIVKINFSISPLDKRLYSFDLNGINLRKFSALEFSCRKLNFKENPVLRIELVNSSNQRSRVYIKNLNVKWTNFKVYLSDFSHISDWSKMKRISFSLKPQGDSRAGQDGIYIDELRFIK